MLSAEHRKRLEELREIAQHFLTHHLDPAVRLRMEGLRLEIEVMLAEDDAERLGQAS